MSHYDNTCDASHEITRKRHVRFLQKASVHNQKLKIKKKVKQIMTNKSNFGVEFEVFGNYALFSDIITRPGGEKSSYPIPTYEALKGICASIYWKPTFIWYVDSVRIMNPITTTRKGIRTLPYKTKKGDMAYYTYLNNVRYQVKAHFEWNMNRPQLAQDRDANKHRAIFEKALTAGGRRDIFLGTRECQGYVIPCEFGKGKSCYDNSCAIDYGIMYHGTTYPDEAIRDEDRDLMTIRLWHPIMNNGVIDFIRPEDCDMTRHIFSMKMKIFDKKHNNINIERA